MDELYARHFDELARFCTEEQEAAVGAVSRDVASIGGADDGSEDAFAGTGRAIPGFKVINASEYVM